MDSIENKYTAQPAAYQSDYGIPTSFPSHPLPSNILIRSATTSDLRALADCFYTSFYPSNLFWKLEWPPSILHDWWIEAFRLGIEDDDNMRTFVAVDTNVKETTKPNLVDGVEISSGKNVGDGRVVAFARWMIPVAPDEMEEKWPELPDGLDMNIIGPFFTALAENRPALTQKRSHWCKSAHTHRWV